MEGFHLSQCSQNLFAEGLGSHQTVHKHKAINGPKHSIGESDDGRGSGSSVPVSRAERGDEQGNQEEEETNIKASSPKHGCWDGPDSYTWTTIPSFVAPSPLSDLTLTS
jgi:hypothetical protein